MSYSDNSHIWIARKSKNHLAHDWIEKPAMKSLLPDLKSQNILCLGCGSGEEVLELSQLGASYILGIDSSNELIEFANNNYSKANKIEFKTAKIEDINESFLEKQSNKVTRFDLVYSSLALHYIEDWERLLDNLRSILEPNAQILFSVHHPIKWGSQSTKTKEQNSFLLGYSKNKLNSNSYKVYGDYMTTRQVDYELFNKIPIQFYHRSISTMWNEINNSGYQVLEFLEPKPIEEAKSKIDFWEVYSRIPLFLIWKIKLK